MNRIGRRVISIIFAAVLLFSQVDMTVFAAEEGNGLASEVIESEDCITTFEISEGLTGDLNWKVEDKVLTISGTGKMADYTYNADIGSSTAPWSELDIEKVIIKGDVSYIGNYAFYGCDRLLEADLPETVTAIGHYAFAECKKLKHFEIPQKVSVLSAFLFQNCISLKAIYIPMEVTEIGNSTFIGCKGLTEVVFQNDTEEKKESKLATIRCEAFKDCSALKKITFPKSLILIEEKAFSGCFGMERFVFEEDSIKSCTIREKAFEYCTMLSRISLKLKLILQKDVFANSNNIKTVYYAGSETDWAETYKIAAENEILNQAEIIYNSYAPKDTTVTVYFDAVGGECVVESMSVAYGFTYGSLPIPTKKGYNFLGWKIGDKTITSNTKVETKDEHFLIAEWEVKNYNVIFDAQNGSNNIIIKVRYNGKVGLPQTPDKMGSLFLGWYTEPDGGEQVFQISSVTSDMTLYAHWKMTSKVPNILSRYEAKSEAGGCAFVKSGTTLKLYTESSNYVIKYTTNGENPLESKTVFTYTDEIEILQNMTVKAVAMKDGYMNSDIWEHSFCIADEETDWGDLAKYPEVVEEMSFKAVTDVPKGIWVYGIPKQPVEYCGTPVVLKNIKVFCNTVQLVENKEYTIKFSNHTNAGTALVTITGKDAYSGNIVIPYEIGKASFTKKDRLKVEGDFQFEENSKIQKAVPKSVSYYLEGKGYVKLTKNKDYTISYPDTRNGAYVTALKDGEQGYIVRLTGKGNYEGEFDICEMITDKKLISKAKNATIPSQIYHKGQAITVDEKLKVTYNGKQLLGISREAYQNPGNLNIAEYDYIYEYQNHTKVGTATILLTGINEYRGTKTITFQIKGTEIKKAWFHGNVTKSYQWTGDIIEPISGNGSTEYVCTKKGGEQLKGIAKADFSALEDIINSKDSTVTEAQKQDAKDKLSDYDFVYSYTHKGDNKSVGTKTILLEGINAYTGSVSKNYKITGKAITSAKFTAIPSQEYSMEEIVPELRLEAKLDGEMKTLNGASEKDYNDVLDEKAKSQLDYIFKLSNNINAGKAEILITGVNGFSGTVKRTFQINKVTMKTENTLVTDSTADLYREEKLKGIRFVIVCPNRAEYKKGGANAEPEVYFLLRDKNGQIKRSCLKKNEDYTLSYQNNDSLYAHASVIVTGKGNFTGSGKSDYIVTSTSFKAISMKINDIAYQRKAGTVNPKIEVMDGNGKTLSMNVDYVVTDYWYVEDTLVEYAEGTDTKVIYKQRLRRANEEVGESDIIPAGTVIKLGIEGRGAYRGSEAEGAFRIVNADINQATVTVKKQEYFGAGNKKITLSKSDITIKLGNVILENKDYEIVGYENNQGKGMARAIIHGLGDYGGYKTINFQIVAKSMNYTVKYHSGATDATGAMADSSIAYGGKLRNNTYKKAGYEFQGWSFSKEGDSVDLLNQAILNKVPVGTKFGDEIHLYAVWKEK